jgi:hypothetical protein
MNMEGQRERTSSRRRQRRKAKSARGKVVVEPVLIAARRPDSPRLENGFRTIVASAQPKGAHAASSAAAVVTASPTPKSNDEAAPNGHDLDDLDVEDGLGSSELPLADAGGDGAGGVVRRRAARIVQVTKAALTPGNREQQLLDRLLHSQGRGAISRAADDLWESKFVAPKRQEIQIQLLEHENEHRARDAVFIMAELLQREAPIKRPVLDQRLRRLETSAEDPITRDAAGALRRSMRVHHGL